MRDGFKFWRRSGRLLVIAALSVACDIPSGPSLVVEVDPNSLAIVPTTSDSQICCCRLTAVATNRSEVAVHATIRFQAFGHDAQNEKEDLGGAVDFLENLQPGERRPVNAQGLVLPCSQIDYFKLTRVEVRAVWFPE